MISQPIVSTSEKAELKEIAADVVRRAMAGGATAGEAVVREGTEFSTVVRLGHGPRKKSR